MSTQHLSLLELNTMVQDVIDSTMHRQYWVEAELSEVNERRGHLYLDLVQKAEGRHGAYANATPVARAQARCWASTWGPVKMHFERVTGQRLSIGMKVLLQVYPQFHPAYGFSWIVTDIDPTFTLGDMARQRQEIIQQLKDEGVFDMQRELALPMFCQRIAVISSATAAGYGDFCNQLKDNDYGLKFHVELFPAVMQGEQVEPSIINALNQIYERLNLPTWGEERGNGDTDENVPFDCVVIIRGGGATVDMSGFDTLALAENVAQYPIPIITGIGHDRDECILDMVSHTRVKTPTAAAAFLIGHLAEVSEEIDLLTDRLAHAVRRQLETERVRLAGLSTRLPVLFSLVKTKETSRIEQLMQRGLAATNAQLNRENHRIDMLAQRLPMSAGKILTAQQHRIDMLTQRTATLDPQLVLRRGYSMTLSGGKVVTSEEQLMDGEVIETRLANGTIISKVWKKQ